MRKRSYDARYTAILKLLVVMADLFKAGAVNGWHTMTISRNFMLLVYRPMNTDSS